MNSTRKRSPFRVIRRMFATLTAMALLVAVFGLYCADAEGVSCAVICSNLNVRQGPSTDHDIITQLMLGDPVRSLSEDGDWTNIEYGDGQQGWVYTPYIIKHTDLYADKNPQFGARVVLDLSEYQGNIDWDYLALDNIYGVILRLGINSVALGRIRVDDKVGEYYSEAKKRGIHVGMYLYSAASGIEKGREEARFVLDTIADRGWKLDLPVYFDAESPVLRNTGADNIRKISDCFMNTIEEAGYYAGLYANSSWMNSYYDGYSLLEGRSVWVADYRGYCGYSGPHDMWQYTSSAVVRGVDAGTVDLNVCYIDLAAYIKENGLNRHGDEEESASEELSSDAFVNGYLFGDADLDGVITASDARLALRISARLELPREITLILADADCDGIVSAADARTILRVSARLEKMPEYIGSTTEESTSGAY